MLTSPYSVEIRNDSIISHLPYYGRAYSIPYGGGDSSFFSFLVCAERVGILIAIISNKEKIIRIAFIHTYTGNIK